MQRDARMLEAALFTKPKSQIGLGNIRPVSHFDLFDYLCSKYSGSMRQTMNHLENEVTEKSISELLDKFDDTIIDKKIKQLVGLFIMKRRDRMIEIFNRYDNTGGV